MIYVPINQSYGLIWHWSYVSIPSFEVLAPILQRITDSHAPFSGIVSYWSFLPRSYKFDSAVTYTKNPSDATVSGRVSTEYLIHFDIKGANPFAESKHCYPCRQEIPPPSHFEHQLTPSTENCTPTFLGLVLPLEIVTSLRPAIPAVSSTGLPNVYSVLPLYWHIHQLVR